VTAVVLHPIHPPGVVEALGDIDLDVRVPAESEISEGLVDDGILVTFRWDDRYIPNLRWLQSISAGHDQFPVDEFRRLGVVLTSASGVHAPQVTEHAFALLLSLTRGIGVSTRLATEAKWKPMMLAELTGRTMAVLGLGTIGEEVARRARAWGLRVIGSTRHPADYRGVAENVVTPDKTADLFREADIVVSVLPGGPGTTGLVTRSMLESLGGWFVNVGRGNVVTEEDLLAALESGGLLGAGLDVFETEPLPSSSPLWSHPRVVITPHNAGFSPHYGRRLAAIVDANLPAHRGEGEWMNRVV